MPNQFMANSLLSHIQDLWTTITMKMNLSMHFACNSEQLTHNSLQYNYDLLWRNVSASSGGIFVRYCVYCITLTYSVTDFILNNNSLPII